MTVSIGRRGIRNSHLSAIPPTGTASLLAGNVSSGIEPIFAEQYRRRMLASDGCYRHFEVDDYACRLWKQLHGNTGRPEHFADVHSLEPDDHLRLQAALQPYVDNAISKTVNVPADTDFGNFKSLYRRAHELGLKGCTAFRPNPVCGRILSQDFDTPGAPHCCSIDREAD